MRTILALCLFAWQALAGPVPTAAEMDAILKDLASITGFAVRHAVPSEVITKDKVNQFLKQRMKEVVKPKELRAEELTLKMFGFVPPEFNLESSTVDLLTEQAAAFYDFRRKRLFLTDWGSSSMGDAALVHELAHALADQSFHLERFLKRSQSDEGTSALSAVMEGQATWLMTEYAMRKAGQSLATAPGARAMLGAGAGPEGQFPVFDNSPLYLRETLVFPYTAGLRFQHAVFEKLGQAGFRGVFENPPASTQQILHPEKYFERVRPTAPELPKPAVGRGYKALVDGSIGELDHRILLQQYLGVDRAALAARWRGGRYRLFEKGARVVLVYASQWESEDDARTFFESYREILAKKWKRMETTASAADTLRGVGDPGGFELARRGAVVTSVEGLGIN